ncbi:hypothetical protein [uncultured Marivita sp.]|uniref:hypothetical protein n=1 Tax=uncultured Marivita sp. TaxID=888080 RepID=UPI00262278D9|nr:hypothetical protein [uncultured Marivita sp.]
MTNTDKGQSTENKPLGEKAKEAAASVSNQAKNQAQGIADTVTTEAGNYAGQAKDAAADEVKSVASALRTAAEEMRSGSPQERTFSQIAEGLADASDAVRDKDLGEMVGAVSDFARRNPMVFLGSAALIGFAATRFAKASSHSTSHQPTYGDPDRSMERPVPADRSDFSGAGGVASSAIKTSQEGSKI